MMGGKLGKLAMELAEETAADLNLDMNNTGTGKDVFENVSKTARHELLLLYLRYADYGNAFYLAQVMEKLYGRISYLCYLQKTSYREIRAQMLFMT